MGSKEGADAPAGAGSAGAPAGAAKGPADGTAQAAIRLRAAAVGLPMTDAEVRAQVVGVARLAAMADEVRALLEPGVEPSGPAVAPWREPRA